MFSLACAGCAAAMGHGVQQASPPIAAEDSPPPARVLEVESAPLTAADVSKSPAQLPPPSVDYYDEVSERGQRAHGLYFSAPMVRRLGVEGIVSSVRSARMNAAVIDIKDDQGRISFATTQPDLQASRHVFIADAPGLVRGLQAAGIYTIARIVCFNDSRLSKLQPERAIHDTRPGHEGDVWNAHTGRSTWLDPYNERNHDLLIALASEVETLGFDEIQLDYIRFPVDATTQFAVFPAQSDKPRADVLLGFLRRMDAAVHIPLGVDVFGLTAFRHGDPAGLGQSLEAWAAHIEVFSPMLYVNGMKTWMTHQQQERAGLLVAAGVKSLRDRVGPEPVIRPYLQAFANGADYYNGEFIAEQIRGARAGGGDGFLFWHPGSTYAMVREGMSGAVGEIPFRIDERANARKQRGATQEPAVAAAAAAVSGDDVRQPPQGS